MLRLKTFIGYILNDRVRFDKYIDRIFFIEGDLKDHEGDKAVIEWIKQFHSAHYFLDNGKDLFMLSEFKELCLWREKWYPLKHK